MIKLYHAQLTRSIRIIWLLEELGIPYELATVAFKPPRHSFEQNTPSGKFPVIEDGSMVMSESGAILEYLIEKYGNGRLAPAIGSADRGPYLQWLHFAEATAFPPIGDVARHTMFLRRPSASRRSPPTVACARRTPSTSSNASSRARSTSSATRSPALTSCSGTS
jgi:glutathione S-transferase